MEQEEAETAQNAAAPGAEMDEPVEFFPPAPPAPLLGPVGVVLAVATFFYFFL